MAQSRSEQAVDTSPTMPARVVSDVGPVEPAIDTAGPLDAVPPQAQRKSGAGKVGLVIILLLMAVLAWHVTSDLMVPSSSTGSVTAVTALVAPRVAGQVKEVLVADNQQIAAGEPMFALDAAPFDLAVRQAEANLAQVIQTVDASVISLASTEAKVNQAQTALDGTRATTERSEDMFGRGLISQAQVDTARSQLASAVSALAAAEADLNSAVLRAGGDLALNPQVETAQVQVEQARLNRSFATVVAPADGVVTNLKLAPGQFINAGTPVLTFIESNSLWVIVDMRENQLVNVSVGDEADVLFDGVPGQKFAGRVRGIAWGIDPGRTAANGLPQNQAMARWFEPARTIPVHIELTGEAEWPNNVRVGSMAGALVYANGRGNPIAGMAGFMQSISSYISFLY